MTGEGQPLATGYGCSVAVLPREQRRKGSPTLKASKARGRWPCSNSLLAGIPSHLHRWDQSHSNDSSLGVGSGWPGKVRAISESTVVTGFSGSLTFVSILVPEPVTVGCATGQLCQLLEFYAIRKSFQELFWKCKSI